MGAVVEIWFESLIPFLLKDSHIVQWLNVRGVEQIQEGIQIQLHQALI